MHYFGNSVCQPTIPAPWFKHHFWTFYENRFFRKNNFEKNTLKWHTLKWYTTLYENGCIPDPAGSVAFELRIFNNVISSIPIVDSFQMQRPRENCDQPPRFFSFSSVDSDFKLDMVWSYISYRLARFVPTVHDRSRLVRIHGKNVKPFLWPDVIQRVGSGILFDHASGADASGVQRGRGSEIPDRIRSDAFQALRFSVRNSNEINLYVKK